MKPYSMFNYDYLFTEHFMSLSIEARYYYIKLNFYANKGFVPDPIKVLESLNYGKDVYYELLKNREILSLPDRSEVFIAAYYVHNYRFDRKEIKTSPYFVYWKNRLVIKQNGMAALKPKGKDNEETVEQEILNHVQAPNIIDANEIKPVEEVSDDEFKKLLEEIEEIKSDDTHPF